MLILFGLGSQLGAQSTYFNMRYPEVGKWGGGTRSIVTFNNSLFLNKTNVNDTTGFLEQTFANLDISDGQESLASVIKSDSVHFYSGSLMKYSQGGFYDVLIRLDTINDYDYMVVKYNEFGDTLFTKTHRDTVPFLSILDVKETLDSGIVCIGMIREKPPQQGGNQNILLIKLDSLGNEIWRKDYGNANDEELGYSVAITPDGGYVLGGIRQVPGVFTAWESERPYIIKTDGLGNIEWEQVYGAIDTTNAPAYNIITTQDGGYAFVGAVGKFKFTGNDEVLPWVVKLDNMGDTIWTQTLYGKGPNPLYSRFIDVVELSDGSLVVCGQQTIDNPDTTYAGVYRITGVIAKFSAQGDSIWSRNYMHPENIKSQYSKHELTSIVQTDDGGFAAAGYLLSAPPDTGTQDTWVVKVDSFGCLVPGCEVVSVPKIETSIAALKIYPNPTHNILNIEIIPNGNPRVYDFELYDLLGKRVLIQKLYPYQNTISVSGLASGIYTYKIDEVWGKIVIE